MKQGSSDLWFPRKRDNDSGGERGSKRDLSPLNHVEQLQRFSPCLVVSAGNACVNPERRASLMEDSEATGVQSQALTHVIVRFGCQHRRDLPAAATPEVWGFVSGHLFHGFSSEAEGANFSPMGGFPTGKAEKWCQAAGKARTRGF